jgi:hypothetical protein
MRGIAPDTVADATRRGFRRRAIHDAGDVECIGDRATRADRGQEAIRVLHCLVSFLRNRRGYRGGMTHPTDRADPRKRKAPAGSGCATAQDRSDGYGCGCGYDAICQATGPDYATPLACSHGRLNAF